MGSGNSLAEAGTVSARMEAEDRMAVRAHAQKLNRSWTWAAAGPTGAEVCQGLAEGEASLSGKAAARLVLLEKATGEMLNEYRGHANASYPIQSSFAHTDAYVASGSESSDVMFWDLVAGGKPVHTLRGHAKAVASIAFHKEDPVLLTASYDSTVRVWDQRAVVP